MPASEIDAPVPGSRSGDVATTMRAEDACVFGGRHRGRSCVRIRCARSGVAARVLSDMKLPGSGIKRKRDDADEVSTWYIPPSSLSRLIASLRGEDVRLCEALLRVRRATCPVCEYEARQEEEDACGFAQHPEEHVCGL